jgi:hypothetical protein
MLRSHYLSENQDNLRAVYTAFEILWLNLIKRRVVPRLRSRRVQPLATAISLLAITCFVVACGSNNNSVEPISEGNGFSGSSGSVVYTAGTAGSGLAGTTTVAAGGVTGSTTQTKTTGGQVTTSGSGGLKAGTSGSTAGSGGSKAGVGGSTAGTGGQGGTTHTTNTGPCTKSTPASASVTGSGPHKVTVETNSDSGIKCGTIFRPTDLGGAEKYPIFVWGEGGCSQNGLSNQAAMSEIASYGYFIVADGTPNGTGACTAGGTMGDPKAFLDYITWAIAENDKPCSAYYQSLDTTKIAADGFSCGGLMAENAAGDPRFTAIGITSSGLFAADQNLYKSMHTPIKILLGGSGDIAYSNGMRDFDDISALGTLPIILFSKDGAGHGGDLSKAKGDFNTINLAWLNWQLKGDTGATGEGVLVGSSCKYCNASGWEYKSANVQ